MNNLNYFGKDNVFFVSVEQKGFLCVFNLVVLWNYSTNCGHIPQGKMEDATMNKELPSAFLLDI